MIPDSAGPAKEVRPIDTTYLTGTLVKALSYPDKDPEAALMYARKSAECICTDLFSREVGDPGNNRLDKLIELLANKEALPERIKIPLRVIQQYGNYAAHVQTDRKPIDRPYRVVLGATIRRRRKQVGITIESLAEKADLHPNYLGRLERGEEHVSIASLLRIAKALGVRVRDLVVDI